MNEQLNRRDFLTQAAAGSVALQLGVNSWAAGAAPAEKIVVGVMGLGGRGTRLAQEFEGQAGSEVAYVCDPDQRRAAQAAEAVEQINGRKPQVIEDFRRILDDRAVDVLVIAAPDHWHAPATILGCKAGKHVYVEKPCSHNPREGELMVAAARKYDRRVQLGTQRRSWPAVVEAIQKLREGAIGKVLFARGWYTNPRESIGHGKTAPVPEWLNYELWQGPAPRTSYRDNVVHYNWHWFWNWGTSEIGNNGVHTLDVCRWGLGVDYPERVSSSAGKIYFDDDRETPDTHIATFNYGDKMITWEGRSWHARGLDSTGSGIAFYGDAGSLVIGGADYRIYDRKNKELEKQSSPAGDSDHVANFLDSIRKGTSLHAEIEEGHKSTLMCHLGVIAHRVGRELRCDPKNGHILNDAEAQAFWQREYEPGWEPTV